MENEKELLKRLIEKAEKSARYWQVEASDFYAREVLTPLLGLLSHVDSNYKLWGGYEEAERVRVIFSMEAPEESFEEAMVLFSLRGNKAYLTANHRDYLGALMSFGIKREKFGDILVREDGADVILDKMAADYILGSPVKIKRVPMALEIIDWKTWEAPKPNLERVSLQVASERLDSIVSKAFNLSRAISSELVKKEAILVNHKPTNNASLALKEGDIISVRGKGKFKVGEVEGLSKKGKLRQVIYLYR